jgi:hypothetical protein
MEGESVQSTFNAQNSQTVWASMGPGHSKFDFPDTSVGASRHRPGDNAGMEKTESAVKTATGDSGTVNGSMMEVEEETLMICHRIRRQPTLSSSQQLT